MALKERKLLGKVTINHQTGGHCEVQEVIEIYDDVSGEVKASRFHRCVIEPNDDVEATKVGVSHITNASWTKDIRLEFKKKKVIEELSSKTPKKAKKKAVRR